LTGRSRAWLAVASCFLVLVAACGGESSDVALDGSPRVPDVEGVVVSIADDASSIELDGGRTFQLERDLESFSTTDGSTTPVRSWQDKYVHLGVEGKTARWIAGVASVVEQGEQELGYYIGVLNRVQGQRLEFKDGTVLRLDGDLDVPEEALGHRYMATIDVADRVVVALSPQ
jgi:hypothetical protein